MTKKKLCAAGSAALLVCAWGAFGQETRLAARELVDLSLEQLSSIVVHSVSRRDEPLARAPASIYVISGDDIRRSGATSLPEALRLAPNLIVARADANQYAISARGFNQVLANKMLVLIDGRTIYTPLFSGTFWEVQDVMLEDIERIEVISGPGATLWGANAVNGVINVITRPASGTQGALASVTAGTTQRDAAARYGGKLGGALGAGHYRLYAKSVRRDNTSTADATPIRDQSDQTQVGFRSDWGKAGDGFTLQGDAYGAEIDQAPSAREMAGANLLGRWTRALGADASLRVQAYYDNTYRHHPGTFKEHLDTYDLEVQHAAGIFGRHRLLWGLGLRHYRDRVENFTALAFLPAERSLNRNHLFAQDEIRLTGSLGLTLGAKIESNSYTGQEFLPNARLAWHPDERQLVWTAASRAVRAPSRIDREFFSPANPPFAVAGGPDFQSEVSNVYELGYRVQATREVSWSVTGFHHDHDKLRTLRAQPGGAVFANDMEGRTSGFETWGAWRAADWWRLSGGFSYLDQDLRLRDGATDLQGASATGNDPGSWWKLRSAFDLSSTLELDVMVRHYDALPDPRVPEYTTFDVRLGWRALRALELSLIGQNLGDRRHPEWGVAPGRPEFERALLLRARLDI
jgi:iron complex outermembrane recepter protein